MASASAVAAAAARTVCVTGASGYIASHLVKLLLARGHTVHGTVRSLSRKVDHLKALPGAERLHLFEADLLKDGDGFKSAMAGCEGLFHTASPFFFGGSKDEFLKPALEGTLRVLNAARDTGIKHVVVTSSMAAVMVDGVKRADDYVYSSANWSDTKVQEERKSWYSLSKTAAERAAWEFHSEHGKPFTMSVVNPTLVSGPLIQPGMNASSDVLASWITGKRTSIPDDCMSFVDVRDVAELHLLVYENHETAASDLEGAKAGKGRFVAVAESIPWADVVTHIRESLPEGVSTDKMVDPSGFTTTAKPSLYDTAPAKELGIKWISAADSIKATVTDPGFIAALKESS